MSPTLSIVVPHYNDGPHLEALLRSVLAQSVRPHEVVIADDASTEPLSPAVLALANQHPWIKIHCFPNNVGPVANTNRAVGLASGDVLVPRSANDLLDPEYLVRLTQALDRFPHAPLLGTSVTYFATTPENGSREDLGWGDETVLLEPDRLADSLTEQHLLHGVGVAINRQELARIGGFDESLRWYADWFATMRIALERGLVYLPGNGGFFRMNPESYGNALNTRDRHQDAVLESLLDRVQASSSEFKQRLVRTGLLGFFGHRLFEIATRRSTPASLELLPLLERNRAHANGRMRARLIRLSPLRRHIRDRLRSTRSALEDLWRRQPDSPVWIYGAGGFGEQVLESWSELGLCTPAGFLVSRAQSPSAPASSTFAGLPIASLDSIAAAFTGLVVLASKSYEAALHRNTRARCPRAHLLSFYERSFTRL